MKRTVEIMGWSVGAAVLVSGTFFGGVLFGIKDGRKVERTFMQETVSQETRLMAWVLKKNPQATIKDFHDFPHVIREIAVEFKIDYKILLAVATKESGLNPHAVGAAGEIGLMQILPATGTLIAEKIKDTAYEPPMRGRDGKYTSLGSLADPRVNLRYGAIYLRWQLNEFDALPTALRAFNRHPSRAREHRPADRYAEDVAFHVLALVQTFPKE